MADQITTAEALDVLPLGSVIRTTGTPGYLPRVAEKGEDGWWVADDDPFSCSSDELDDLPATVLFRPDAPPAAPVDERTARTAEEWAAWSNDMALLLPEEYDGDEAQEAIIERFIRDHAESASPATVEAAVKVVLAAYLGLAASRHVGTPEEHCRVLVQALADAGMLAEVVTDAMVERGVARFRAALGDQGIDFGAGWTEEVRATLHAAFEGGPGSRTIPRALFDQALSDYRQAWHAADAAGREGERSREGLLAALTTVGVEVSER